MKNRIIDFLIQLIVVIVISLVGRYCYGHTMTFFECMTLILVIDIWFKTIRK